MSVLFSKTEANLSLREIGKSRGRLIVSAKLSCRFNGAVSQKQR